MSVKKIILRISEIELSVDKMFKEIVACSKDSNSPFIIAPIDHNEVYRISTWFDMSFSDLFSSLMLLFSENKTNKNNVTSYITKVCNYLHSLIDNINSAKIIWNDIINSRQSIYEQYVKGELRREDILAYLSMLLNTKSNLLKEISKAKAILEEIQNILLSMPSDNKININLSNIRCPITGQTCNQKICKNKNEVFIAYQFKSEYYSNSSIKTAITEALETFKLKPFFPDKHYEPYHITCEICYKIQESPICIFEISDANPNVMFELGLAYMLGNITILLAKNGSKGPAVSDIAGIHRIQYDDLLQCRDSIISYLNDSKVLSSLIKIKEEGVKVVNG